MENESLEQAAYLATQEETTEADLRERIRQITLTALTERQLDKENMKSVIEEVMTGVTKGFSDSNDRLKPAFQASLQGVDDALAKSALAAKLAAEEMMSKTEKFATQDIKQVGEDIRSIEDLLFNSINLVARRSSEVASNTLQELSEHLRNTGTSVGKTALDSVQALTSALETTGKQGLQEVGNTSKEFAMNMAKVASGILAGMSEAIKPKDK